MAKFIKDGKIFDSSREPLILGGAAIHNAPRERWLAANYAPYIPPRPEPVGPKRTIHKFDRYKVILALGDGWETKKAELVAAGLYDAFMASPYLSTADELFGPIYRDLSPEEKRILHRECRYGG